ncbi:MAG: RagB/SusD family nutrient uptake outer membrane protein [Prevotellaceae bacterium]|jgi:hypothetical protein|nr:RagB/SusD family nutrient uptake outer membrane protein [Prevotellaceae bacterium]
MKIKSIISIIILLAFNACTDLSEKLYDRVTTSEYGLTEGEIETIVGRAYASLRGYSDNASGGTHAYPACEYVFFLTSVSSDECTLPTRYGGDWFDDGQYQELHKHTWKSNNKTVWSAWKYCYSGISSVNAVIYQTDKSPLTDEAKEKIFAELRAIRAYYYFRLLDLFGNVPITVSYEDLELPANSSRADVYAFVENELLDIIDLLPVSGYGRMTQNAANCLLARLYLNSEVYTGQSRWQDCLDVCAKITGTLEADYFTNFLTNNEVSQEIIFSIPYDHKAGTVGNYMASMTFHYEQKWAISAAGDYQWCGNGMCAQPGLYSSFEENDIRRKSLLIGEQIDLRSNSVIIMPGNGGNQPLIYTEDISDFTSSLQNEGARLKKYEVKAGETWERDHDLVIMRYAEVLMMQAECYVRLGASAQARPYVEQIRSRAGLSTPETIDLNFINEELKHEFVFEDHRRTDNIRFGDFFNAWWEKAADPSDKHTGIFPIPSFERQKNGKLIQNPGYTD